MNMRFQIADFGFRTDRKGGSRARLAIRQGFPLIGNASRTGLKFHFSAENQKSSQFPAIIAKTAGFSLMELLVVMSLLSLIVLALMNVFGATQTAFRASLTQIDMQEGGRATVEMITADLRTLTPSGGVSNVNYGPVNFAVGGNFNNYKPLLQSLPGTSVIRTNQLNWFFVLSRENTKWIGVGYAVDNTNTAPLYPLYRFYAETNLQTSPRVLYDEFNQLMSAGQWTGLSHIMDGVVQLTVRAYDTNGAWLDSSHTNPVANTLFLSPVDGEAQFYMFSNTVPAAVELQLGVLEDRVLQRAEARPANVAPFLSDKSGNVHLFRQRVAIPNIDFTAYQ